MDERQLEQSADSEAISFLARDFTECFAQMRRYESLIWDICKFTLAAYTSILGVALALYKFSDAKDMNLAGPASAILLVGIAVGLTTLSLVVRYRVYFVLVARYINEHRAHFLKSKPLGFQNRSGMYVETEFPRYFSLGSAQVWVAFLIAGLNATLLGAQAYIVFDTSEAQAGLACACFVLLAVVQGVFVVMTLRHAERKASPKPVLAKERAETPLQ